MGASTRPDGRDGRRLRWESLLANGIEKASVLPLPVLPRPRTSRPSRVSGRVATWIGKGRVMPPLASTSTRGPGTPRSAKVLSKVMSFFGAFQASGVPDRRDSSRAPISTRWRDCRWAISIAARRVALEESALHDVLADEVMRPTLLPVYLIGSRGPKHQDVGVGSRDRDRPGPPIDRVTNVRQVAPADDDEKVRQVPQAKARGEAHQRSAAVVNGGVASPQQALREFGRHRLTSAP